VQLSAGTLQLLTTTASPPERFSSSAHVQADSDAVAFSRNLFHSTSTTIDTGALNPTFSGGDLRPGVTLTKIGTGKLTLANNNTYTGSTTVSAGTLLIPSGATQSGGGAYSVTGALAVDGTIASSANAVTINAAGRFGRQRHRQPRRHCCKRRLR
jgi:autotransporter-associated beta strand protein